LKPTRPLLWPRLLMLWTLARLSADPSSLTVAVPAAAPPRPLGLRLEWVPKLTVDGPPGSPAVVERADAPSGPWIAWTNVVVGSEGSILVDLQPGPATRFYRAVIEPRPWGPGEPPVVTTSGAADPSWSVEELALTVPRLLAADVRYSHFVYDAAVDWRSWTGGSMGSVDLMGFLQKLKAHVGSSWASAGPAAYRDYFGPLPERLTLNISHPNAGEAQEIQLHLGLEEDITTPGARGTLAHGAMVSLLRTAGDAYPSSAVGQYMQPFLPYYLWPKVVNGQAVDAATWQTCGWCGANQASYLAERARLLGVFKQRIQSLSPGVDFISLSYYPFHSKVFTDRYKTSQAMYSWVYHGCKAAMEVATKPVVVDTNYAIDANSNGEWNEGSLKSLPLAQLRARIDSLGTGMPIRLIHTTTYMRDVVFQAMKAAGAPRVNFWNAWRYRWTVAAQAPAEGRASNFEILFNRKILNDLFLDRGQAAIPYDGDAEWASPATRNRVLEACTSKEVELALAFRQLF